MLRGSYLKFASLAKKVTPIVSELLPFRSGFHLRIE